MKKEPRQCAGAGVKYSTFRRAMRLLLGIAKGAKRGMICVAILSTTPKNDVSIKRSALSKIRHKSLP
jgi:hypothetical protein